MKLSDQQYACVDCDSSLAIEACAGSGKTRTMIAKILLELANTRNTPKGILCITYTNTAVNEIESRLHAAATAEDLDRVQVCTIHSFCLNHVVKPHIGTLGDWGVPKINLAPPDSEWFKETVSAIGKTYGLTPKVKDAFQAISIDANGKPFGADNIPEKARKEFIKRVREDKAMIFPLITYFALKIFRERPSVAAKIANKFSWIMVDEFQDTSDIQVEMLKIINSSHKTRFCIVGDKRQSIYGFSGAKPELFDVFSSEISARTDLVISENYRSSELVIDAANRLLSGKELMISVGIDRDYPDTPVPVATDNYVDGICNDFLPTVDAQGIRRGDTAVLAPQWWGLWDIGEALRQRGVRVTGPGARPYKRNEVTLFLEVLVARACGVKIDSRRLLWALSNVLLGMDDRQRIFAFTYDFQLLAVRIENLAKLALQKDRSIVGWLKEFASSLSGLPLEGAWDDARFSANVASAIESTISSIERNEKSALVKDVSILGEFADTGDAIRLMTMHAAKGTEFEAVAIIGCEEGVLPHYYADADEARRLFYVGVTRAKKLLRMYYRKSAPSRFLKATEMGYLSI